MPNLESLLPAGVRALLREPVDLGLAARGRVMQRVREAASRNGVLRRSRGAVRPAVLGALLAASVVASIVTAGGRSSDDASASRTLADSLAMHFAAVSGPDTPMINADRIVAVADATHDLAPKRSLGAPAGRP